MIFKNKTGMSENVILTTRQDIFPWSLIDSVDLSDIIKVLFLTGVVQFKGELPKYGITRVSISYLATKIC
jgi:Glu-tRNA(Gln) amidotransferase subunit E-like FAD-binding protein